MIGEIEMIDNEEKGVVSIESDGKQKPLFTSTSVPAYVIEGLIGEKVAEIFKSVDVLKNGDEFEKLEPMDLRNSKATIATAKLELQELYDCLKDMNLTSLNPRHRFVKRFSTVFLKKIDKLADSIQEAESPDDPAIVESVKHIINWLSTTVMVMSDHKGKTANQYLKDHKHEWKEYSC